MYTSKAEAVYKLKKENLSLLESVEISIKGNSSIQSISNHSLNYFLLLGQMKTDYESFVHPGIKSFSGSIKSNRKLEIHFNQFHAHDGNRVFIKELSSEDCYLLNINHKVKIEITEILLPYTTEFAYLFKTSSSRLSLAQKKAA